MLFRNFYFFGESKVLDAPCTFFLSHFTTQYIWHNTDSTASIFFFILILPVIFSRMASYTSSSLFWLTSLIQGSWWLNLTIFIFIKVWVPVLTFIQPYERNYCFISEQWSSPQKRTISYNSKEVCTCSGQRHCSSHSSPSKSQMNFGLRQSDCPNWLLQPLCCNSSPLPSSTKSLQAFSVSRRLHFGASADIKSIEYSLLFFMWKIQLAQAKCH